MSGVEDPVGLEEALSSTKAGDWKHAMEGKIDSHKLNTIRVLTKLPKDKRARNS